MGDVQLDGSGGKRRPGRFSCPSRCFLDAEALLVLSVESFGEERQGTDVLRSGEAMCRHYK